MSVSDEQSMAEMSSKPVVITPTLSPSSTHSHAYLKSSHVRGSPSDHLTPLWIFQVTVIASPLSPGSLTPPLSTVGIGATASCGMYLKSWLMVTSEYQTAEATLASVTWPR